MKYIFQFLLTHFLFASSLYAAAAGVSLESMMNPKKTVVLVVDFQEDFTEPSGALAVKGTSKESGYPKRTQDTINKFKKAGFTIVGTQDLHPEGHSSFASTHGEALFSVKTITSKKADGTPFTRPQVLWPDHCVEGTPGAEILASGLDKIFPKGTNPLFDSYSGFKDDGGAETGLSAYLRKEGFSNLIIFGLATDYCVKFTVLDALAEGFNVAVISDLIAAVDATAGDGDKAIEEMKSAGAIFVSSVEEFLK